MRIETDFHGASIHVVDASNCADVRLALVADKDADFMQWFCFRVVGAKDIPCRFVIENAGGATFPDAFESYRAVSSAEPDDEASWLRVETSYEGGELIIEDTPAEDEVTYAYFAPYSDKRHALLVEAASERAEVQVLGQSVEGNDLTLLVFGEESEDRAKVWITARQHPGETMAEWFVEGLIERLLSDEEDDPILEDLRARATVYVVPNMCPDGSARGHLRGNAVGQNLNRAWQEPSEDESPEVFLVRQKMEETGVDVFLDIHGDERTPFCFAVGCEGNPSYDARIDALEDLFMESLIAFDENFQRQEGYENDAPGEGDLTSASNWVGERFGCLSLTIEMPFTDNANAPDERYGWSPTRSKALGAEALSSIVVCLDDVLDRGLLRPDDHRLARRLRKVGVLADRRRLDAKSRGRRPRGLLRRIGRIASNSQGRRGRRLSPPPGEPPHRRAHHPAARRATPPEKRPPPSTARQDSLAEWPFLGSEPQAPSSSS